MSTPRSAAPGLPEQETPTVAAEIAEWLTRTPRQLPAHYLYDRLGSVLFEAICHLPWYRIAEREQRLLARQGRTIFSMLGTVSAVVELGPGSGGKLVTLLSARAQRHATVHLVDVSAKALEQAERSLSAVPELSVVTHQATYEEGLAAIVRPDPSAGRALVVFLGSNIGNFDPPGAEALLQRMRGSVRRGDALLIGTDLVKPQQELQLAYDDPLGVTAAFNRNLLVRLNRELGADFDVSAFTHRALWNAGASRMEMHLVSGRRQRVRVAAADLEFTIEQGETIWTESSYKYTLSELAPMMARAGFGVIGQWVEESFGLTLAEAQ
ncbi:MAG TPA: L-histidine N(alpha)-methyltransferase [Vicinamibacterales bacterium]|nr:L-histidine N(alpha)-methyltransferase [Vicinamibacterales bacterium]